jgi:hypothetical protein
MRGTITPIQLHAFMAMAMVSGALATWIGFAAGSRGRLSAATEAPSWTCSPAAT